MPTSPIGPATTTTTPGATRTPAGALGKDDFLTLLAGQMRNQDPMSPSADGQELMAQMTQLSILEQLTNLAAAQERTATAVAGERATALLGRTVDHLDAAGARRTGVVEQVEIGAGGRPALTISGEHGVALDDVVAVR